MTSKTPVQKLRKALRRFHASEHGNVALIFALALTPIMIGVGAAIDYSRANSTKAVLQSVLDAALIAGAKADSYYWEHVAHRVFRANLGEKKLSAATATFRLINDVTYTGSA